MAREANWSLFGYFFEIHMRILSPMLLLYLDHGRNLEAMEFTTQLRESGRGLTRRELFSAAVPAAAVIASSSARASAAPASMSTDLRRGKRMDSRLFNFEDPEEHQRQSYRILRNTHDTADVLFWYHFTMFSVPQNAAPQPVVRWEGIELSHHRRLAPGMFRIHGHNLSFPRDLATGKWTDSAVNPVTAKRVQVPPLALTEDPGYLYTPEGVIPLDNPTAEPRVRVEQFLFEDDLVKLEQVRLPPASWPATFIETSSNWADRQLFEDTDLPSLPTGTAGGYVFPWPDWMGLDGQPGHMFATWHGRKLASVEELPPEFIERASSAHAHLLKADLSVFETALPDTLIARLPALGAMQG
ncbi:MAG: hypothetical protein ACI87W_000267 [Halieaceae bacterium]|jgi:hypothetical protein